MDYMDTVDPRIERGSTKTGRHVYVNPGRYMVRWGLIVAPAIILVAVATIFA